MLKTPAEKYSAAKLGAAVHPGAIRRLHELFPDARVTVRHEENLVELPFGARRMGNIYFASPEHTTRVYIDLAGDQNPTTTIVGRADCHPADNFDRRKGIKIAFRRALDIARRNARYRAWEKAQIESAKRLTASRAAGLSS